MYIEEEGEKEQEEEDSKEMVGKRIRQQKVRQKFQIMAEKDPNKIGKKEKDKGMRKKKMDNKEN